MVFDKTGTLTESRPRVAEVIPGEGYERDDILRTAACLEEHFPHPVARAVVRKAEQEGLHHQEEHTEVEYVVAHGIASRLHGKRVLFECSDAFRDYIRSNREVSKKLKESIYRVSHIRCNIGPYEELKDNASDTPAVSIDQTLKSMQALGVDIKIEDK